MQFIADIMKKMKENNLVALNDLYTLSEAEMIEKIENCNIDGIGEAFDKFRKTTKIHESNEKVEDKFCISVKTKRRYIVPLINDGTRINEKSEKARKIIDNYLKTEPAKYAYLDFNF